MYTELENLPVTLVFKKSKQNLDLLSLLYIKEYTPASYQKYNIATPTPNGLDPLLSEDQVILLIQSSSIIGLPELTYLAASLHQENKQNKL